MKPGDRIVDPAAGSFVVTYVATKVRRRFISCGIINSTADTNAR
jgi:hypothetical protein